MENVIATVETQKTQLEWTAPALWVLDVEGTMGGGPLDSDGPNGS